MPDAPAPVPVAETWTGATDSGTVTFDLPLDQTVPLVANQWARGFTSSKRSGVSAVYLDAFTVEITVEEVGSAPGLPPVWNYSGGPTGLVGLNGQPVADFEGFST